MTTIVYDLWGWYLAALEVAYDNPAAVNPDRLQEFLSKQGLRITFDTKPPPEDQAFDGQYEAQRRDLTARERDILCRIIGDIRRELKLDGAFGRTTIDEWPILAGIRDAIDPRGGD